MPTNPQRQRGGSARQRAGTVARRLAREYPDATCALRFRNPLELLIATILSAQCTDERVNMVTPTLFARYRTATEYAAADPAELENQVRSTGFFRSKARSIRECCRRIAERHGGQVPSSMAELVQLAGVGRKTANVVLGTAMALACGVVVDTHVRRLSRRLGLTRHSDPVKIERVLMELLPPREWIDFSHRVIQHGRRTCTARKPACSLCCLEDLCPKIGLRTKRAIDS